MSTTLMVFLQVGLHEKPASREQKALDLLMRTGKTESREQKALDLLMRMGETSIS